MTQRTPATIGLPLLLASSIHDIKNSLALLMDALGEAAAASGSDSPQQRDRFATMQTAAARINNDLLYLLSLYRLSEGELRARMEEIWLRDFLEEQIAQNAVLLNMRGLAVEIACDDDVSGYFDRSLVSGVINNGLVNAARHARTRLRISGEARDGGVAIAIVDDGDGLPATWAPDRLPTKPVDFHTGSTNLGLHFAREVLQLHQRGDIRGTLVLRNAAGGGAEFLIFLP